jgi:hypothetical protein
MAGVMFGNHLVLKFAPQKIADVTALYRVGRSNNVQAFVAGLSRAT